MANSLMRTGVVQQLLEFNYFPGTYLDERWLDSIAHGALVRKLLALRRRSQAVSRYLFNLFDIKSAANIDLDDPFYRVLLKEKGALDDLLSDVGMLVRYSELRNCISGDIIRRKLNGANIDAVEQNANRAGKAGLALSEFHATGIIPFSELANLPPRIAGQFILASALDCETPAVSRRVALKLGPRFARACAAARNASNARQCRNLIAVFGE